MSSKEITYENDPVEYERVLRQNLSGNNHTKESLIDFGVATAIELEICNLELKALKKVVVIEMTSNNLSSQMMSFFKSPDLEQLLNLLESNGFRHKAALLRRAGETASSSQARKGGIARTANDPKQIALNEIKLEFHKVTDQFKRHGYGAEFCRKMQDKYPIIEDPKTIPKLVTRLKKQLRVS